MMKSLAVAVALGGLAAVAHGGELENQVRAMAPETVQLWSKDATVMAELQQQNQAHAELTQSEIDALDAEWRAELKRSLSDRPLIDRVLSSATSSYLRDRQTESAGLISELFVMDARGLLVGSSKVTSDYWQGDEAKWTETFLAGSSDLHVSAIAKDESTQMYEIQVSLTISDPSSGRPIGALTAGISAEKLMAMARKRESGGP